MNAVAKPDSYAQFMQLVATARSRNTAITGKTAPVRNSLPAAVPQARPETRMMPVVNQTAPAPSTGRILGNYFDAYA